MTALALVYLISSALLAGCVIAGRGYANGLFPFSLLCAALLSGAALAVEVLT